MKHKTMSAMFFIEKMQKRLKQTIMRLYTLKNVSKIKTNYLAKTSTVLKINQ